MENKLSRVVDFISKLNIINLFKQRPQIHTVLITNKVTQCR